MEATAAQAREANDATRGSAVRLAAEVASRLALFGATLLLMRRLPPAEFGVFMGLQAYAVLLAELGELGLQALAARVLAVGTHGLASLVRARLLLSGLVALISFAALPLAPRLLRSEVASPTFSLLVVWFVLAGWSELVGVALRCRGARLREALLLLALRGPAPLAVGIVLASGAGLRGLALALVLSSLPALALGPLLLRGTRAVPAPSAGVWSVLRDASPLAVYAALLLLSPRVEFIVLRELRDSRELGLFALGLNVYWFLAMVPSAIAAGAMPALAREAARGQGLVRRRSAATLALLGVPAAIGIGFVAQPLASLLMAGGTSADQRGAALPLTVLAAGVPPLFLNALAGHALNAAGRAAWLPRLTLARVAAASVGALLLVPRFGAVGAAACLVLAEWLLLGLSRLACLRAGFAVPIAQPLGWALLASVPMALATGGLREKLWLAVAVGVLTWLATLSALLWFVPRRLRQLTGEVRYP